MFKNIDPKSKTFYSCCSDWESVVKSDNHKEAASLSLEEAFQFKGENLNLSKSIITINLTDFLENFDQENVKILKTHEILANIGKYKLSKQLKQI